jgi:uncharacterized membrane protein YhaH (DUF805 family)
MDWQSLFLSAEGRISRKDFWIAVLILMVAWALAPLFHILAPVIWLLLLFPWICVFAKRLHDFGKSGWFIALPFVVGIAAVTLGLMVGGFAALGAMSAMAVGGPGSWAMAMGGLGVMLGFLCLAGIAKLIFVLWVGLSPGDPGPNAYGPPTEALIQQH